MLISFENVSREQFQKLNTVKEFTNIFHYVKSVRLELFSSVFFRIWTEYGPE